MQHYSINFILCVLILMILAVCILWYLRKVVVFHKEDLTLKPQSFDYHKIYVGFEKIYNDIIYMAPENMGISFEEAAKRRNTKDALSQAKRNASVNDFSARVYLFSFIGKMLHTEFGINETTIDYVFPFNQKKKLDAHTRFLVLMYTIMQEHGSNAWIWLMEQNELTSLRENGRYEIYQSDIDMMFEKYVHEIPYLVKINVLSQRLYEDKFGQGPVDLLTWQNIEDISVGLAGISVVSDDSDIARHRKGERSLASFDQTMMLYKGISIHLCFLGMNSASELERVCRHICLYKNKGELTEDNGRVENTLANGDRVVVFRDSFGDRWGLTIRKNNEGKLRTLSEMYPVELQKNAAMLHDLLSLLMIACQSTVISGQMYSGKSTLLKALVEKSNPNYNYRCMESIFELNLSAAFPTRSIVSFLEREDLTGDKVLEFLKRTNGTVFILGEMLKEVSANWLISACQSGFKFALTTTHTMTTEFLIKWLLNAKLNTSGSSNSELAILDIVNAVHFDVHCGMNELTGERYVERVTEIVPTGDERLYELHDIMVYDIYEHTYQYTHALSERTLESIRRYVSVQAYEEAVKKYGVTPQMARR